MDERLAQGLMDQLNADAQRIALRFGLRYKEIAAERAGVKRRYGICYADGRIRIRLHSLRSVDLLKYSAMVDTLCHELAHLRHFNHGKRFWALYRRILAYARRHGIYRPGPEPAQPITTSFRALPQAIQRAAPRPAPPRQLELF